jgi:L-ascorbate metabolism protein UlaG (beta-lactamase superfamily)
MEVQETQKIKYFLTLILIGIILVYCPSYGKDPSLTPQERMENSPQYQNGKFHNAIKDLYDVGAAWRAVFVDILLSKRLDPVPQQPPPIRRLTGTDFYIQEDQALRFVRIGHSTIMLQIGEKVWLLDPVFSERVSLFQWVGPKRFHPVPIKMEDLPPIEGVLISHNHFDHLDHDTILQLKDRVKHFFVPLGLGETLVSWGVLLEKITELDWWEKTQIGNVELISTPAQHFSGRGLFASDKTLWTSWVIRTPQHSVFFSGDSGYFEGFKEIGEKYGPFDLTFLECGAYHKSWRTMHMMPEDNLEAIKDLKGKVLVPIHNGTFDLASHSWYDPMEQIMTLALKAQIQFVIPLMGQIVDENNIPETVAWWNHQK